MFTIKLSEEQKECLLEMCTKLFPEYKLIELASLYSDIPEDNDIFCIQLYNGRDYTKTFHWYEFCMTHLADAICEKINAYDSEPVSGHPVDYFYELFLLLKL